MKRPATPAEPGPPASAPVATQDVAGVLDWRDGAVQEAGDTLIRELPVALVYNGVSHVVMMATPTQLEEFALGFSLSEGILARPGELHDMEVSETELGIEVAMHISGERFAALKNLRRNLAGRTGCGLCGAESLQQAVRKPEPVTANPRIAHAAIERAVRELARHQPLQAQTGAVHGAAWCAADGAILELCEDVGRHNALDKLIGARCRRPDAWAAGFVLISSRASYEMVVKAASQGIAILAAVSAPTALAIELAETANLTLVGFARPGRHVIYTHPQRISGSQ
ncbi:MAG: sulfurtransferase FdhD [Porticoccaceae bacterium]